MNIFIEVNNYCELKCRFCIADLGYKYPSTNISTELIDEIINTYQMINIRLYLLQEGNHFCIQRLLILYEILL